MKVYQKNKEKEISCNDKINILDIRNNTIYTKDNDIVMAIKIHSINIQLFSEKELENKVKDLTIELTKDLKEIKFLSISRPVDVTAVINNLTNILNDSQNEKQKILLKNNIRETRRLTVSGDVVERQNFITMYNNYSDIAGKELLKMVMDLADKFNNCGIKAEILKEQELLQLCNSVLNINFAFKEDVEDYLEVIPFMERQGIK